MYVTVSLVVEIPAHVDINQMGLLVQEAGQQAGRVAEESKKWCPHGGSQAVLWEGTDHRTGLGTLRRVVLTLRRMCSQACRRRFRPADDGLRRL